MPMDVWARIGFWGPVGLMVSTLVFFVQFDVPPPPQLVLGMWVVGLLLFLYIPFRIWFRVSGSFSRLPVVIAIYLYIFMALFDADHWFNKLLTLLHWFGFFAFALSDAFLLAVMAVGYPSSFVLGWLFHV